jgi:hypothetical protein
MPLVSGTRLGPYEILAPIGAGGMGEVYKARDSRLERTVAIKVSKEQFSERFAREARSIAALNHPHICMLHDVGPNYLVMEYIEGRRASTRSGRGMGVSCFLKTPTTGASGWRRNHKRRYLHPG